MPARTKERPMRNSPGGIQGFRFCHIFMRRLSREDRHRELPAGGLHLQSSRARLAREEALCEEPLKIKVFCFGRKKVSWHNFLRQKEPRMFEATSMWPSSACLPAGRQAPFFLPKQNSDPWHQRCQGVIFGVSF